MTIRINILSFLLILSLNIHAQEYIKTVQHFNLEKGLETRNIRAAFKDSKGFMWFATDIGAYRFDGYEFKPYKRNRKSNSPLFTKAIAEDDQNNLWFFHTDNYYRFQDISILPKGTDTLVTFNEYFKNSFPFPTEDMLVSYDATVFSKAIYIINKNDGAVYEFVDNKFIKRYDIHPFDPTFETNFGKRFFKMDIDSKGNRWILSGKELVKISIDGATVQVDELPIPELLFQVDEQDRLWFWKDKMVFLKENENTPITKPSLFEKNITEKGRFFKVNRGGEFIRFGGKNEEVKLFKFDEKISINVDAFYEDFKDHSINHYFLENENTLWVSTFEGIFRVTGHKNPFQKYLVGKSTRAIRRGFDDKLWVSSYHGFFEVDTDKKTTRLINGNLKGFRAIFKNKENKYWMGHPGNFVYQLNSLEFSEWKKYVLEDETRKEGGNILFLFEDVNQNFWAGTQEGLYQYNKVEDRFDLFKEVNEFTELNELNIHDFQEIKNSKLILFATPNGIFELDLEKGITNHYCSSNNNFPYDHISYIHQDKQDGTLWITTKSGGIIHWDYPSGQPQQLTKEDGLSDNMVYAVYEDTANEGYLWLPSNYGLMHFNKKTNEVVTYNKEDGLIHDEFNFDSHFQDKDGTLYFGGIQGVTAFHPKDIAVKEERLQLYLTELEVLDKEGELVSGLGNYNKKESIELFPSQSAIEVSVALVDYLNPEDHQFFYQIKGLETNWNLMKGNTHRINNLPSGDYELLIKAKSGSGLKAANQLAIPIRMLKPFYLRGWFIALMALLLYVAVRMFIKRRTYLLEKANRKLEEEVVRRTEQIEEDKAVIEKQAEDLKELDKLKSRFFANVTHELRTPLTLITGPLQSLMQTSELDAKTKKTLEAIAQNGDQLKRLIEEILDLNRIDAHKLKLNKEPIQLQQLIERWMVNFEPEAENRKIKFKLDYNATRNLILNLDVQKLESIVTNLLSNAFKFSRGGDTISLKVLEKDDQIKIEVEDTGIGIHEEDLPNLFQRFYQSKSNSKNLQGGLGIGLSLCDELAKLMKGEISVISKVGQGSTFTLVFPKEKVEGLQMSPSKEVYQKPVGIKKRKNIVGEGERKNILIVEDNLQMQEYVHDILEPFANIKTANNGKEALEILHHENSNIDLIVSDVMMPEMDGFTLLKVLKLDPRWQMTPIVMLTALSNVKDKIKALTIGVDDYIFKPFAPNELVARVENLLAKLDLRNEPIEEDEALPSEEPQKENYKIGDQFKEIESADVKWLKEVEKTAMENITTSNFNVAQFAFKVHIGERQLSRKLKKLTGMTPGNYLKEIRLQTARHLLENKAYSTVAEISNHVGFSTPEYFSKIFKKRFGKLPTEYTRGVKV